MKFAAIGALLLAAWCWQAITIDPQSRQRLLQLSPLGEAPVDSTNRFSGDPQAAEFGRWLFYEPRLSRNQQVSCATCHQPAHAFADTRKLAKGLSIGSRHTQSLLNAAHQHWLTWNGRADSLWSQALHPFQNDHEMGLTQVEVIQRIREIAQLRSRYEAIFGALPQADNDAGVGRAFAQVGKSIAAFERRLQTGPSPLDGWLEKLRAGDASPTATFSVEAIRGALLFVGAADCVRCHNGPLLSDGEFHMIGVPESSGGMPTDRGRLEGVETLRKDPFNAAGAHSDDPHGSHAKVTLATVVNPESWGQFRTPSLRSAALSPPYMHQGQLASLEDVVRFYNTLEGATALDHHAETVLQPLHLSDSELADLVFFLQAAQGSMPAAQATADPFPDRPATIIEKLK